MQTAIQKGFLVRRLIPGMRSDRAPNGLKNCGLTNAGGTTLVYAVVCSLSVALPEARAEMFSLSVDSKSNIFASGLASTSGIGPNGPGTLPPFVTLPAGVGRVLQFSSVTGAVSYNDVDAPPAYLGQYNGPDGGAVLFADANFPGDFLTTSSPPGLISPSEGSPTTFYLDMDPYGGISGMNLFESVPADRRVMFLAGVFLTDAAPSGTAPASLDFSSTALGRSFSVLAPELQQTFYIGDGLTGTGSGSVQSFLVPDNATRLFLGFVDGSYFVGGPDYYDNNVGSFAATFEIIPEIDPDAFAGVASLLVAALALVERRSRRPVASEA
jgi:hypothetical protein